MEFEARGGPAHTRALTVRVEHAAPGRWIARGALLDLRKRGLVPMAGDLQTAGVIHHMRVEAEIDTARGTLAAIRAEQPSVAFEASPGTGGECCRDPVARIETLAGSELDGAFATRLGVAIGGPRGCSHVLTLAQAVGSAARLAHAADRARFGDAARRPGERVFQRSLAIDGVSSPEGALELVLQQADVHCAPAPADAQPFDRLARHHELRVHASVDLDAMALRRTSAAERSAESAFAESSWRDRDADVAWLSGRPAMGGIARAVLERFGDRIEDAPLRDALLHLSPTIVQCIPAIAERWRAAVSAGGGAARPNMIGSGGMTDSCYMWRRDGFMAKRIESELRAFREAGAKRSR
jgi:hypothetical protein